MAPDVPTIAEQGYPGFDIAPWYGIVAPKGTPAAVVGKLNAAVNRLLRSRVSATAGLDRCRAARWQRGGLPRHDRRGGAAHGELVKQSGVSLQ